MRIKLRASCLRERELLRKLCNHFNKSKKNQPSTILLHYKNLHNSVLKKKRASSSLKNLPEVKTDTVQSQDKQHLI
jgi:hypothetical protein